MNGDRRERAARGLSEATLRAPSDAGPLRLAFADPPYPGQAKRYYGEHPDYAGEVDHGELVARLMGYDGWALCTAARSLRDVLGLCPAGTRVMVWCKPGLVQIPGLSVAHGWEPVLIYGGRRVSSSMLRDWILCAPPHWQWSTGVRPRRPAEAVTGMKPDAYCRWVFEALGARADDTLDDLFPGSGAVSRAWDAFIAQPSLLESRHATATDFPSTAAEPRPEPEAEAPQ